MLKALTPHPTGSLCRPLPPSAPAVPSLKRGRFLKAAIVAVTVGETNNTPGYYRDSHNIALTVFPSTPLHTPAMPNVDTHDFESPHNEKNNLIEILSAGNI